jgi:hypothetical protein
MSGEVRMVEIFAFIETEFNRNFVDISLASKVLTVYPRWAYASKETAALLIVAGRILSPV